MVYTACVLWVTAASNAAEERKRRGKGLKELTKQAWSLVNHFQWGSAMGIIDPKAARRLKELGPKIQVTLEEFVSCDKQVIWNTSVWKKEVEESLTRKQTLAASRRW